MEPPRHRLVVCADDYALTPGVSRGIRELLEAGRISATSVMTVSPHWPAEAEALRRVAGNADIGLHLTLTDQTPIGAMHGFARGGRLPSVKKLIALALARRLPLPDIEAEVARQIGAFLTHYGRPPRYIDGHHHVHQLPGIRAIVIAAAKRLGDGAVYLRDCHEPGLRVIARSIAISKALLISALGHGFGPAARAAGLMTNSGFLGVYDFAREKRPFGELARRFVSGDADGAILMCHPGYVDADLAARDPMTKAREAELAYFKSDAWPALLAETGVEIGPLRSQPR